MGTAFLQFAVAIQFVLRHELSGFTEFRDPQQLPAVLVLDLIIIIIIIIVVVVFIAIYYILVYPMDYIFINDIFSAPADPVVVAADFVDVSFKHQ